MTSRFDPLFTNPHVATIAGNFWRRRIDEDRFPGRPWILPTGPASSIKIIDHQPDAPIRGHLVFLHGLEGSAEAGYIRSMAQAALEQGYVVHRANLRSCGGTEHLSDTMYHSGLTIDTRVLLERIREEFHGPLVLIGFSLGGNVTLKLAAELSGLDILTAACAVSTPLDLAECVQKLDRPSNFIYARRFLERLKSRVVRKAAFSPHLYRIDDMHEVKSIWAFDDRFTGPLFGFGDAATYYRTQSSQNFLDDIRIPTLVVQAKDDPLIPFSIYERQTAFATNPFLHLLTTERGGHLGFLARRRPRFWLDAAVLGWIERVAIENGPNSSPRSGTNRTQVTSVHEE